MVKEKFNNSKTEKVKIGKIGDVSHGEQALNAFIKDVARDEAKRRNCENVELPKKKGLSKQTKALLKSTGKLTIENAFEYFTPEEVYEEYSVKILESMKRRVGKAFNVESAEQLEMGENSDKARTTEFDGKAYYAARVDVKVKAVDSKKSKSIIFMFSPFTVTVFGVRKEFSDMGKIDKELTLVLRENMKKEFGEVEYNKALRKYNKQINDFKQKLASGEVSL